MSDWMSTHGWWLEGESLTVPSVTLYGRIEHAGPPMRPLGVRSLSFSQIIGVRDGKIIGKRSGPYLHGNTFNWHSPKEPLPDDYEEQIAAAPEVTFVSRLDVESYERNRLRAEREQRREEATRRLEALAVDEVAAEVARRKELREAAAWGPSLLGNIAKRAAFDSMNATIAVYDHDVRSRIREKAAEVASRVAEIVKPVRRRNPLNALPKPQSIQAWWGTGSARRVGRTWTAIATAAWGYDAPGSGRQDGMYVAHTEGGGRYSLWSTWGEEGFVLGARARFEAEVDLHDAALVLLRRWYEELRDEDCLDGEWPLFFTPGLITEDEYRIVWITVFGNGIRRDDAAI